jgi:uncharacterized protein (UPF0276 family)
MSQVHGVGIGWRQEIDLTIDRMLSAPRPAVDFVEIVAENVHPDHVPATLAALHQRGVPVIAHGVSLSLGGTDPLEEAKLGRLAALAGRFGSPLVSEHVAFCRGGGVEAGHLLPVPRTREALDVLARNIRQAQAALPVPLAVENIAALIDWPEDEMTEAQFLGELVERTGVLLLLDVANLHTARVNFGTDPVAALDALPLEQVAYVHVAGGVLRDGVWHDTHAHPVPAPVMDVLAAFAQRSRPLGELPGALLERDDAYPSDAELAAELAAIRAVTEGGEKGTAPAAAIPHARSGPGAGRVRA